MDDILQRLMGDSDPALLLSALGSVLAVSILAKSAFQRRRFDQEIQARRARIRADKTKLKDKILAEGDVGHFDKLVALPSNELLDGLKDGSIKSLDAVRAFTLAAIKVDTELNCVTEFIELAEQWARERDSLPADKRGPLHGLPIAVKDNFKVKGSVVTNGMTQYMDNMCTEDAVGVALIKDLGGVPFCITNVPQTCMSHQCSNPVFGATGNPHNPAKEAGGSSGGTSALVGGGGAVLGLGNDLGGSLRNPAAMCGVYSLKPTHGRHLSAKGLQDPLCPNPKVPVVSGFIADSVHALVEAHKSLWGYEKTSLTDVDITPLSWRQEIFESDKKLKIGYSSSSCSSTGTLDDGASPPPPPPSAALTHPGYARAISQAKALLEECGHSVVPYQMPNEADVAALYGNVLFADDFDGILDVVAKERRVDQAIRAAVTFGRVIRWTPKWVRKWVIQPLLSLVVSTATISTTNTVHELLSWANKVDEFHQSYVDKMNEDGIDLLITPGCLVPAPDKGLFGDFAPQILSTYVMANILNLPAGIVPITKVTKDDQNEMNNSFKGLEGKMAKSACQNSEGLPLAIQIIGRRYHEEKILRVMGQIEATNKFPMIKQGSS